MQKLKAILKYVIFAVEYVYGCSVHILLFRYGIDNWNWYFVIGVFEVKCMPYCVCGVCVCSVARVVVRVCSVACVARVVVTLHR